MGRIITSVKIENISDPSKSIRCDALVDIGYIILEQSQAAVDMVGHRLMHVKRVDLK